MAVFLRLAAAFSILLLAGCGGLLPKPDAATNLYSLNPAPRLTASLAKRAAILRIDPPATVGALDNDRMALRQGLNELRYFAGARWADRMPKLMQANIVNSLQRADLFAAVLPAGGGVKADWVIESNIAEFQARYLAADGAGQPTGAPVIDLVMTVALRKTSGEGRPEILQIRESLEAQGTSMAAIIAAFDAVQQKAVGQITAWAHSRITP